MFTKIRNPFAICLVILSSLLLCNISTSAQDKEDENKNFLFQKEMAGVLKLVMSSTDLYSLFDKNITELIDLKLEGYYCPAIAILFII